MVTMSVIVTCPSPPQSPGQRIGVRVAVGKAVAVLVGVSSDVCVWVGVRVRVGVVVSVEGAVAVGLAAAELHPTSTDRCLKVLTHGSPKTLLLASTLHDGWPTQAAATMAPELAASHDPFMKEPQVPWGVP